MGTEDLFLDLKLMSSIFQTQHVIEGQQPIKSWVSMLETLYW